MKKLVNEHAKLLCNLMVHLLMDCEEPKVKCRPMWAGYVQILASRSAVCAVVHPSHQLAGLLNSVAAGNPNITDLSAENLSFLQQEFPVLFELIYNLQSNSYEYHSLQHVLAPVISEMVKRANAPFAGSCSANTTQTPVHTPDDVSFFPHLPSVRVRRVYTADKNTSNKVCTKHRIGHPTLLPGVFTLFCQHSKRISLWEIVLYTIVEINLLPGLASINLSLMQSQQ